MDSQSQPEFVVEQAILERMRFYHAQRLNRNDEEMLGAFSAEHFKAEVDYDIVYNDLILRFETDVLSEHLVDNIYETTHHVRTPYSWWDMLVHTSREKWWGKILNKYYTPKWFDEYYPVRVKVERYLKYPQANIKPDPRLGRAIPFERLERLT